MHRGGGRRGGDAKLAPALAFDINLTYDKEMNQRAFHMHVFHLSSHVHIPKWKSIGNGDISTASVIDPNSIVAI